MPVASAISIWALNNFSAVIKDFPEEIAISLNLSAVDSASLLLIPNVFANLVCALSAFITPVSKKANPPLAKASKTLEFLSIRAPCFSNPDLMIHQFQLGIVLSLFLNYQVDLLIVVLKQEFP